MGQQRMDKPPTKTKPSPDLRDLSTDQLVWMFSRAGVTADLQGLSTDQLVYAAIGRMLADAAKSKDAELQKRAVRMRSIYEGKGLPTFQKKGVLVRGEKEQHARVLFDQVNKWLDYCRDPDPGNEIVSAALLMIVSRSDYVFECHPDGPSLEDCQDPDNPAFLEAVRKLVAELDSLRIDPHDTDAQRVTRAVLKVLGMDEKRINNMLPGHA